MARVYTATVAATRKGTISMASMLEMLNFIFNYIEFVMSSTITTEPIDLRRQNALLNYHKKLTELRKNENTLKERM